MPVTTPPPSRPAARLARRARLAHRVWLTSLAVALDLRARGLPAAAASPGGRRRPGEPVPRLSRAVDRCLRIGRLQPRCIVRALVLYRLLRAQGDPAELVIGLRAAAPDRRAHAWVELGGRDVGPRPGRAGHVELVRFGR